MTAPPDTTASDATASEGAPPRAVDFPPDELKATCEEIVARYPDRKAACLPVLLLAQEHYDGWISPEVEAGVADWLGVSDSHIRGLLTFYAMYNAKPAGRHEVWVCRTLTCMLRGARDLRAKALDKAGVERCGEVGEDGRFLVKDMECLGLCEVAPAVFLDGRPHVEVTPEKLGELMDDCE